MENHAEMPVLYYAEHFTRGFDVTQHQHHCCELILPVNGRCTIESSHGIVDGTPGKLLVIPPEVSHNQINEPGSTNFFCLFQASPSLLRHQWRTINVEGEQWLQDILYELDRMSRSQDTTGSSGLLHSLLERLARLEQQMGAHDEMHPSLVRALNYLHRHYTEPINIDDVTRHAAVSTSFLRKLFIGYCKMAPVHYLQHLRLIHAQKLLCNPYLSVSEVATQCGFNNPNYFIRLYSRAYGKTPGKDRTLFNI